MSAVPKNIENNKNIEINGYIEKINEEGLSGWFINLNNIEDNELLIKINGVEIRKFKPFIFREDISQKFTNGNNIKSGFIINWKELNIPENIRNQKEWKVEVFYKNTKLNGENLLKRDKIGEILNQTGIVEHIKGNIDAIEGYYIYGWVYNPESPDEKVEINVYIDGKNIAEGIADKYRKDLEEAGIGDGKHAFEIKIPEKYLDEKEHEISIHSKKSGMVIGTPLKEKLSNIILTIDLIKDFIVSGWISILNYNEKEKKPDLSLKVNDHIVPLRAIFFDRKDVEQEFQKKFSNFFTSGFEFGIPGYVWNYLKENEDKIKLEIVTNNTELAKFEITKENIIKWIENIINDSDLNDFEWQYKILLALEHIKYSKLLDELKDETKEKLFQIIEKFDLWDFVKEKIGIENLTDLIANDVVFGKEENLLYFFLKNLNFELYELKKLNQFTHEKINFILKKNIDKIFAVSNDEMKVTILASIIPFLCSIGMIKRVEEFFDLDKLISSIKNRKDTYNKTVLLSLLSLKKDFKAIEELLWKINPNEGWVATECIYFTVNQFRKNILKFDSELIDKFYYAFINFIDSFHDKWFSRLYDKNIIQSAVNLLDTIKFTPDYVQKDYISFIVRNYGLNKNFWKFVGNDLLTENPDLQEAYNQYIKIYDVFTKKIFPEDYNEIVKSYSYFLLKENYDVKTFIRENIFWELRNNPENKKILKNLIDILINKDSEIIRFLTHPLIEEKSLFNFLDSQKINNSYDTIRYLSKFPLSNYFHSERKLLSDIKNKDYNSAYNLAFFLSQEKTKWVGLPFLFFLSMKDKNENILLKTLEKISQYVLKNKKTDKSIPSTIITTLQYLYLFKNNFNNEFIKFLVNEILDSLKNNEELTEILESLKKANLKLNFKNPFSDTLVVIYSCQKNLNTRIKTIRETWLKDLEELNIPYLIVVGGGDDNVRDDVLYLNVSDDYEYLPQKSLKLYEWIYYNTQFQYVYKIDDDCYFNVKEFFSKPTYKKHHYYGRIIERDLGTTNRLWHMKKSKSEFYKNSIDKSPEPSKYADGGGGYSLSRYAIYKLLKSLKTKEGQLLVSVSIMEDKLIGDLLRLSGISPSNEEYITYQRRKTHDAAKPVGLYENTFYPTKITPISMVHLDTDKDMYFIHNLKNKEYLLPKKIFSTIYDISDIYINQLELLTNSEKLQQLIKEEIHLIATVRNEKIIIPHFLEYYRNLGVKCFLIVDNLSDDGTRELLLEQPDVVLFSTDGKYSNSHYGVVWQQALMSNFSMNKWVLLVDADEYLIFPDCEEKSIYEFINFLEKNSYDSVRADLVDIYSCDNLDFIDFSKHKPWEYEMYFDTPTFIPYILGKGHYSNCDIPTLSHFRHRIIKYKTLSDFTAIKFPLFKYSPWIRVSEGIHFISGVEKILENRAYLLHYKYNKELKKKVIEEVKRKQHFNNAIEYKRYAVALSEISDMLYNKDYSTRYINSKSIIDENETT